MKAKTDAEILAERAAKYGDAGKLYGTWYRMAWQFIVLAETAGKLTDGQKGAMLLALMKTCRIAVAGDEDSFTDGRNYLTLAESNRKPVKSDAPERINRSGGRGGSNLYNL